MASMEEQSQCDCWEAMLVVLQQAAESSNRLNLAVQSHQHDQVSLSERLIVGQNLVTHWEVLNGCARSETHINSRVLRLVADAVDRVLSLYEKAVGASGSEHTSLQGSFGRLNGEGLQGFSMTRGSESWPSALGNGGMDRSTESTRHQSRSSTTIWLGGLQLEDDEELVIVRQEALRNAIIRLGAMLQDVEEELRRYQPQETASSESPLREGEVRDLMSRLFRLLGRVNVAVG